MQPVTLFESPPACSPVGSSRVVALPLVVTNTLGPACIGVGDRSVANPNPACAGSPAAPPPVDPFHGQIILVPAGDLNTDVQTVIQTFQCVSASTAGVAAAIPTLPWSGLAALAVLLALAGGWYAWQRSAAESHGNGPT